MKGRLFVLAQMGAEDRPTPEHEAAARAIMKKYDEETIIPMCVALAWHEMVKVKEVATQGKTTMKPTSARSNAGARTEDLMDLDWGHAAEDASELGDEADVEEFARQLFEQRVISEVRSEIVAFRNEAVANLKAPPNKWWKNKHMAYKHLSRVARVTLAIPAAQVENEKVFSAAGLVTGHLRTRMSLERLADVVFLMKNTNQEQVFHEILKSMGDKAIAHGDWAPASELLSEESILDMGYARLEDDDGASSDEEAYTNIGNDMSSLVDDGYSTDDGNDEL